MTDKPITVEEYQEAGKEFWPKYWYVAKELGENAKAEDILKVMESLSGVAMRKRTDDKSSILTSSSIEKSTTSIRADPIDVFDRLRSVFLK